MPQFSRIGLGSVTATTMAVSTFPQVVFGVLAAELIGTFGVERWQIGVLVTATGFVGAFVAPSLGQLTHRLGSLTAIRVIFLLVLTSMAVTASAPTYALLVVAAALSGAPQGWCNPATNTLISEELPAGDRGVVTGIKQSGVQAGAFVGGLLMPVIAAASSWRVAIVVFMALPLAGLVGTAGKHNRIVAHPSRVDGSHELPDVVKLVAIYGVLAGLGTSAMLTFLPLFASESQGWSEVHAGWLLAGVGLIGVGARIAWARVAESRLGYGRSLEVLALLTVLSAILLALMAAEVAPSSALPIAAALLGAGSASWNSVGMLAVMERSPAHLIGRGTGVVLFGFLLGYGLGAPMVGFTVDRLDSYLPAWLGVSAAFLVAFAVARRVAGLEPANT